MSIFWPLWWSTTSAWTLMPASTHGSLVTASPSTRSRVESSTVSPTLAVEILSTSTMSPTATLCWRPPLRTMAYTRISLSRSGRHPRSPAARQSERPLPARTETREEEVYGDVACHQWTRRRSRLRGHGRTGQTGPRRAQTHESGTEALPVGHALLVGGQQPLLAGLGQGGRLLVLGRQQRGDPLGPLDADLRVERVDAVLALGCVPLRAEVDHGGVVGERHEPVAESLGEVDGVVVLVVQADDLPLAEGRRAGPDVHDHVEDRAAHALDVLGLPGRHVGEVDATQGAPAGDGHVGLGQAERVARGLREGGGLEPLVEAAPAVGEDLRLEHPGTGDGKGSHRGSQPFFWLVRARLIRPAARRHSGRGAAAFFFGVLGAAFFVAGGVCRSITLAVPSAVTTTSTGSRVHLRSPRAADGTPTRTAQRMPVSCSSGSSAVRAPSATVASAGYLPTFLRSKRSWTGSPPVAATCSGRGSRTTGPSTVAPAGGMTATASPSSLFVCWSTSSERLPGPSVQYGRTSRLDSPVRA